MGIRYYAYPVPPEQSSRAAADPGAFLGEDPLADAWGLVPLGGGLSAMDAKPRPEMLYLDKAWRLLQRLTCPNGQARSAHQLFEGDVTYDQYWRHRPYTGVLEPSKVVVVAADLSSVDETTICEVLPDLSAADHAYVVEYLHAAKEFVADLAERGWGMVYTIG